MARLATAAPFFQGRSMIDWTISFGNALTILSFFAGGIFFVVTVRGRVDFLSERMEAVEAEVKQLVSVLVQQGRHEERMSALEVRLTAQGKRLDETIERLNRHIDASRVP